MAQYTLELTDQEVLLHTQDRLQEHLPLHADGYKREKGSHLYS